MLNVLVRLVSCVVLVFALLGNSLYAANISGIVNQYASVTAVSGTDISVDDAVDFAVNDTVMLMQMQGAQIETFPDYYGEILDYGSVGQFEIATITAISGNTITLNNLNKTFNSDHILQLIKVADYRSESTTTITNTINATAWDGSKGGVVAIMADELVLDADINASGKGFRGGQITQTDSVKGDLLASVGAQKGEGIAKYGAMDRGRAAQATGGGAGDWVNTAGAGGANYGSGSCGDYYGSTPDDATIAISGWGLDKLPASITHFPLMLGGGGGAGDRNDSGQGKGGAGGGVIMLFANKITANSGQLISNGNNGITAPGDASGGGGAGGSIYLDVATYSGALNITANGGAGGNKWGGHSAGGGGGAGALFVNNGVLPSSVTFTNNGGSDGTGAVNNGVGSSGGLLDLDGLIMNQPPRVSNCTNSVVGLPRTHDYGDAPDTGIGYSTENYPTLLNDNGARHKVSNDLFLGASVPDIELDALQSADATGDDTSNSDDEDSAILPPLSPSHTQYAIKVNATNTTGADAYLYAWIDWNRDGYFESPEAQVITIPHDMNAQTVNVSWDSLPAAPVDNGKYYLRLRLTSDVLEQDITNTTRLDERAVGEASNGEVEDYLITASSKAIDFGDLADSFNTTVLNNGAYHFKDNYLFIGKGAYNQIAQHWDGEIDGQPSALEQADQDDVNGSIDDEADNPSGIIAAPIPNSGTSYSLDVNFMAYAGNNANHQLRAWIDWNQDGEFSSDEASSIGQTGLQKSTTQTVTLSWSGLDLSTLNSGDKLALRVRLTTDPLSSSAWVGGASDGEVEDHYLLVGAFDYGDAPDTTIATGNGNYQTSFLNNGAGHGISSEVYLGAVPADSEATATIPTTASFTTLSDNQSLGDNVTGSDEDIVINLSNALRLPPATSARSFNLRIPAVNTSGKTAYLVAWYDANRDGDFADAGEQSQVVAVNSSGEYLLDWQGLSNTNVTLPQKAVRIRISTDVTLRDNPSPYGLLSDGEVEDIMVNNVAMLSGYVYQDANNNLAHGATEVGLQDISVHLYADSNGDGILQVSESATPIASTLTSSDGYYRLLPPSNGAYFLKVDTNDADLPSNMQFTGANKGDTGSSEAAIATDNNPLLISFTGANKPNLDFPFGALDKGDAPSSYGDVSHSLGLDAYIGAVAPDPDGNLSGNAEANADEQDGINDEGDLFLPHISPTASTYNIYVKVTNNSSTTLYLAGFLDVNQDGVFENTTAEESARITISANTSKYYPLTWKNLSGLSGHTYLRLRLSNDSSPDPTGAVTYGEVEDHRIEISDPQSCSSESKLDVVFLQDNGTNINAAEYAQIRSTMEQTIDEFVNSAADVRVAVAEFTRNGANQQLNIRQDFTAANSASAKSWTQGEQRSTDGYFNDAFLNLKTALDGTDNAYLTGVTTQLTRRSDAKLVIIFATDHNNTTYLGHSTYLGSSMLKAAPYEATIVGWHLRNSNSQYAAANTSLGGSYTGSLPANLADPEGSQNSPRRLLITNGTIPAGMGASLASYSCLADQDFGDAPDTGVGVGQNNYATTLLDNGARHGIHPDIYLGATPPDKDADGQQNLTASGDDTVGMDDEDGVTLPLLSTTSTDYRIQVTANNQRGKPAYLHAWIDWNRNGYFEISEYRSALLASQAGVQVVELDWESLPITPANNKNYIVRVRLTTDALADDPTSSTLMDERSLGAASDGEVEDYAITATSLQADFGDLPDSYGTTALNGGAYHLKDAYLYIGNAANKNALHWDAESDGQPSELADQDDSQGIDDESELTLPAIAANDDSYSISVPYYAYAGNNANHKLRAWIDFNGDGQFSAEEASNVFASGTQTNAVQTATLSWSNLSNLTLKAGKTALRIRLTTDDLSASSWGGYASDGEVEDHLIEIVDQDYGDAASSFGIASHSFDKANNVRLGAALDLEVEAFAVNTLDDAQGVDDEDGVATIPDLAVVDSSYSLSVNATNASNQVATIYAWLDVDGNGKFEADEFATNTVPANTASSDYTLFWNSLPSSAEKATGDQALRVRITTDTLTHTGSPTDVDERSFGVASNGEVEDHTVEITYDHPSIVAPDTTDTDGDGVFDVVDIDDDNDGVLDINENVPLAPINPALTPLTSQTCAQVDDFDLGSTIPAGKVRYRRYKSQIATAHGALNYWCHTARAPNNSNLTYNEESLLNGFLNSPASNQTQYGGVEYTFWLEAGNYSTCGGWDDGYSIAYSTTGNQKDMVLVNAEGHPQSLSIEPAGFSLNTRNLFQVRLTDVNAFWQSTDYFSIISATESCPANNNAGESGVGTNLSSSMNMAEIGERDTDQDTIPDHLDLDSDNDGIPDNIEAQSTASFTPPSAWADADGDGLHDVYDADDSNVSTASSIGLVPHDQDSDGTPDFWDLDSDNAQGSDTDEAALIVNATDADRDGLVASVDSDDTTFGSAHAGISDLFLAYPDDGTELQWRADVDSYIGDAIGADTDRDGIEDHLDIDDDNDGILDYQEGVQYITQALGTSTFDGSASITLTFPSATNQTRVQATTHQQGVLLINQGEAAPRYAKTGDINLSITFSEPVPASLLGVYFNDVDSEAPEYSVQVSGGTATVADFYMTGVANASAKILNYDGNGKLTRSTVGENGNEQGILLGKSDRTLTSLTITSTGIGGDVVAYAVVKQVQPDKDNDGVPNHHDLDSDNDGIPDNIEAQTTDGFIAFPTTWSDSDNDGLHDTYDNNDASAIATASKGFVPVNTDAADEPDFLDTDSDNAQADDTTEAGLTLNTIDADHDGLVSAIDSDDARFGSVSAGITNILNHYPSEDLQVHWRADIDTDTGVSPSVSSPDTDGDGVNDDLDIDDDNDGVPDFIEGSVFTLQELGADSLPSNSLVSTTVTFPGAVLQNHQAEYPMRNGRLLVNKEGAPKRYLKIGNMTATLSVSEPVPINDIGFFMFDLDSGSNVVYTITVSGGTATTADLAAEPLLINKPSVNYNPATGEISRSTITIDPSEYAVIKGRGNKTFTTITVSSQGLDSGDYIAYGFLSGVWVDSDNDTLPNHLDLDSDNDGIPDNVEAQSTNTYIPPALVWKDVDQDGLEDTYDQDLTTDHAVDSQGLIPVNTDGTDKPDILDTDSDNAENNDTIEAGLTLSGQDSDKDGLDNAVDSDNFAWGSVNAGVTDVKARYPSNGTDTYWRLTQAQTGESCSPASAYRPWLVKVYDDHNNDDATALAPYSYLGSFNYQEFVGQLKIEETYANQSKLTDATGEDAGYSGLAASGSARVVADWTYTFGSGEQGLYDIDVSDAKDALYIFKNNQRLYGDKTATAAELTGIEAQRIWFDVGDVLTIRMAETGSSTTALSALVSYCGSNTAAKDYSDAPSSYGAAAHIINNTLRLGSHIDEDSQVWSDGVEDAGRAQDDDNKGSTPDDEDAITTFAALTASSTDYDLPVSVSNTHASDAATLYGWIDFNNNGKFEANEAATPLTIAANSNQQTVNLHWANLPTIVSDTFYVRLRLTTDALTHHGQATDIDQRASGLALDGEVEDHYLKLFLVEGDYGDAPDTALGTSTGNYKTSGFDNGAVHLVPSSGATIYLGDLPPNAEAQASISNGDASDEAEDDGVRLGRVDGELLQGQSLERNQVSYLYVKTQGAGVINAWIDLNGDGDFDDVVARINEKFAINITPQDGLAELPVVIPAATPLGEAYVRVRYSSDVGLDATGQASNGEVEDYQITITERANAGGSTSICFANKEAAGGALIPSIAGFNDDPADGFSGISISGANLVSSAINNGAPQKRYEVELLPPNTTASYPIKVDYTFQMRNEDAGDGDTLFFITDHNKANGVLIGDNVIYLGLRALWNGTSQNLAGYADVFNASMSGRASTTALRYRIMLEVQADGSNTMQFKVYDLDNNELDSSNVINNVHTLDPTQGLWFAHTTHNNDPATQNYIFEAFNASSSIKQCDYGDLNQSYGLVAHDSASNPSLFLGTTATDVESQLQNTSTGFVDSTGDDTAASDDEDGVFLGGINGVSLQGQSLVAGDTATITAKTNGNGKLSAWIDWNADGDFKDSGEQVAQDLSPSNDQIEMNITVPSNVVLGTSYARFRYASSSGLPSSGEATDGEVEDYEVEFTQVAIPLHCSASTASVSAPWSVHVYDSLVNDDASALAPHGYLGSFTYSEFTDLLKIDESYANRTEITDGVGEDADYSGATADSNKHIVTDWQYTFQSGEAGVYSIDISDAKDAVYIFKNNERLYGDINATAAELATIEAENIPFQAGDVLTIRMGGITSTDKKLSVNVSNCIERDFGDLPAPYLTLQDDDGARHEYSPDLGLGVLVNPELDGFKNGTDSSLTDTNDATTGLATDDDSDDGVFINTVAAGNLLQGKSLQARQTYTLKAQIHNPNNLNAKLFAWIDWNRDGDFLDANEQVLANETDTNGDGVIQFNVTAPNELNEGATGVRIRLSTESNLSAKGNAADGEVEDYLIQLVGADDDGDGISNQRDIDDDNDGLTDEQEGHTCTSGLSNMSFSNNSLVAINHNQVLLSGHSAWRSTYSDNLYELPLYLAFKNASVGKHSMMGLHPQSSAPVANNWNDNSYKIYQHGNNLIYGYLPATWTPSGVVKTNGLYELEIDNTGYVTFKMDGVIKRQFQGKKESYRLVFSSHTNNAQYTDIVFSGEQTPQCTQIDTDNDGIEDHLDLDSDNDGIPDNIEAQASMTYKLPDHIDVDLDGLDDAYDQDTSSANKAKASSSIGLVPVNTDSDTDTSGKPLYDYLDLDTDNDGVFDLSESGLTLTDSNNDGKTDGAVGTNGLDNSLDTADDYSDVNGTIDDPKSGAIVFTDLDADVAEGLPMTKDLDYRDAQVVLGYNVSGYVYLDANFNEQHDATENGVHKMVVVLYDVTNDRCTATKTDASGFYQFQYAEESDYQVYTAGYKAAVCDPAQAADLANHVSVTENASTVFTLDSDVSDINFGDISLGGYQSAFTFVSDNTSTVGLGNTEIYLHQLSLPSQGSVTFSIDKQGADWVGSLFHDADCSGDLDNSELAIIDSPITVSEATTLCIQHRLMVPMNAKVGEVQRAVITADFSFADGSTIIPNQQRSVTNSTTAYQSAGLRTGKLVLTKYVRNVTQMTPETKTINQAKPDDVLEYRIVYSNQGSASIVDLNIQDMTPEFTQLVPVSTLCNQTPAGLSCSPAANDPYLEWLFTGELAAGAEGDVVYRVQIE